ncbi:uncharacterized protein SCHCODRAFT_02749871 [Schizophyllum commune H4-8]|uniref:Expressed protein n=1 Tax=Schizophyllum commune (strain H4-8 / FGSC 9210) TaxID=578458 RepID=D8QAE9_SCHCM|nr:uncharacterized protein SCHCODRAFT_02749871 [Schizophyllum commune H4-8]KAI5890028.1 hypothetical protein SCHCODRAFT_02749871 [Schizophyllum commune H4-8]
MDNVETPRSPSVQSFASADTVSVAFTSTPGSPTMSSASDTAATRAMHEANSVPAQAHPFYLQDGNTKLKLDDDTFYNVHRYFFERHAPRFAELYLRDGQPDIIEIHDVSSIDFQRFLSIIYPNELGVCDIHTVEEWTSVLRLASAWSVASLRQVAIREIEPKATPVDKIVLARKFGLGETWLLPAFVALCRSSEPLEYEDAERLGLRSVLEIVRINREVSRSGESYDVEAAVRASAVFLSPGTDVMEPRVAVSEPSIHSPSLSPSSTPVVEHGPRLPLIDTREITSRRTGQLDTSDDLSYMALLASERAEEEALKSSTRSSCYFSYDYALGLLRIAYRLISETSIAAVRHRGWRELCLRRNGYTLGGPVTADRTEADVSWEVRPSNQDNALSSICRRIVQYICDRLSWAMASRWEDGHELWNTLTVQVPQASSQYTVASCVLDVKVLLKREGIPFAQDAGHADCVRVVIPSPSRDWFIPDDL